LSKNSHQLLAKVYFLRFAGDLRFAVAVRVRAVRAAGVLRFALAFGFAFALVFAVPIISMILSS
jgi:hypothetical protein